MSKKITAMQARKIMQAEPNAVILDVRTPSEFASGRISGAILLPDYEIREKADTLLPNKNATVLVYCRSGIRSIQAAHTLNAMGYTNVCDFGGIIDWPYEKESYA